MKQSQWAFEVHNCLCFSQRLRRFNKQLQLTNGYKSATLNENTHWSAKLNKTSYYRKQTNHWNCWVTWNSIVMVCYEHGLLWKWSVLNGLLWVVSYERVCFEWEPFWSIVMFLWVTTFKLFTVIGFSAKVPSHWRWWCNCICCNNFDLRK